MPEAGTLVLIIVAALLGFGLGWLAARLLAQRRITELQTTLDLERKSAAEARTSIEQVFAALSARALRENNQAFLQLAQESLKQFHVLARGELEQREKAVEHLVQPLREALEKTAEQIRLMEKERQEAYGSLRQHLLTMQETQQLLHGETRNLVQALRRPEVRGQWGELTLKRLAELAGMVEHCDFSEQVQAEGEDGRLRPDMVVRMPGGREIVVDAKTPLDAYLSAIEAPDDETRKRRLEQHAQQMRSHVKELAGKAYWGQFRNAPDFVVLFVPGDQFLAAALDADRGLLEDALRQKVILTTPTSFVALLRAVAFGWRQESLTANAERIRELGESLYQRLATFSEHLARLGRSLGGAVSDYNKAVGSFEAKVLPGAQKFTELGITAAKPLENPEQIEKGLRQVEDG
ncbi:MAG: recombinase RmuC [Candidatus Muproteobacteria bacterium RBG_16_65_34]|uniref:Recombinase RmuC n=1 Tax=Candidatus Muproteobacteria bacterium RBG_16_65_34 TaxID=1817760 RepID=A0A1F6TT18_9PROT|nr:MAG: recombinase RmuC [Candidatus Muproteobacteria bacterium RBG_16_65_34]